MKRTLIFIFFLVGGILIGTFVGELSKHVPMLSWLGFTQNFGIGYPEPINVDLAIIKFNFGFMLHINLSQIIFIFISMICYKKFRKGF